MRWPPFFAPHSPPPHQADHAAAIDEFNLFAREQRAQRFRRRDVFRADAFVRAAINGDAFHACSAWRTFAMKARIF
jgi:hypothetical protein